MNAGPKLAARLAVIIVAETSVSIPAPVVVSIGVGAAGGETTAVARLGHTLGGRR